MPRPSATTDWVPQFAAKWPDQLPSTLNYKHFDCDGDGLVLDLDVDVIEPHYSPIDSSAVSWLPGAPAVWLQFDQDTILVNANNPEPLKITASVMVGSPEAPALGLHGLAFALKYPEYVDHDPEVDYKNDFFGISNRKILKITTFSNTMLNFNRWIFTICEIITFKVDAKVFWAIVRDT